VLSRLKRAALQVARATCVIELAWIAAIEAAGGRRLARRSVVSEPCFYDRARVWIAGYEFHRARSQEAYSRYQRCLFVILQAMAEDRFLEVAARDSQPEYNFAMRLSLSVPKQLVRAP